MTIPEFRAPLRRVVERRYRSTRFGGGWVALKLECGHYEDRPGSQNPTRVRCKACLSAERAAWAAQETARAPKKPRPPESEKPWDWRGSEVASLVKHVCLLVESGEHETMASLLLRLQTGESFEECIDLFPLKIGCGLCDVQ